MTLKRLCAISSAAAALLLAAPARAQFDFCFGPTIQRSVPNPVFDGNIDKDNGWLNCFLYRGGNGAPDANIILQGNSFTDGTGHNWLALGVTALNDVEWDAGDAVVVLFKSGSTYGALVVSPLQNDVATTANPNGRPGTSSYFTSTTGAPFSWTNQSNAPTWVTWGSVATVDGSQCIAKDQGSACKWTVELGFDLTAAGLAAFDKLFVDVVEVYNRQPIQAYQSSWPPGLTISDFSNDTIDLTTAQTPAMSSWGSASTSSNACKGLYVGFADIAASPLNVNGNLTQGVTTHLTAQVHNSGAQANGVAVHFSHAPFGVCGLVESCFQDIAGGASALKSCPNGGAGPCCAGAANCVPVDLGSQGTTFTTDWTPTVADEGHQCIRVKLEATQGGTTFANMGDFHNMWVDHSSELNVQAQIDMRQVPPPEGGGNQRVRLHAHSDTQYLYSDGTVPGLAVATFAAQIVTQYRAFRFTGKHLTLNKVRSEIWEPVGSYAYTIQHEMRPGFQTTFEQQHLDVYKRLCLVLEIQGDCLPSLKARMATDPRVLRRVNTAISTLERPPSSNWSFDLGGVTPVGKKGDQFEVQVPLNGVVTVPTHIKYVADGGTCQGCFCCLRPKSNGAPALIVTGLLLLAVGLVVHRRRP
jgi:hypothetical protein